ncbi:hypothetical protein N7519_004775 [Penicillium mononematosum]|uniref:uncharacterized protein n=1 Tax=Penicillium mononematosum TaxID=268346 RepID=UPI002549702C|nr:uncharacterized protein N7519_004775 [Penicillium mononematosum]KAJ6189867.1 hypothetical protein N7519_004775 [Penicillium mononematosum]
MALAQKPLRLAFLGCGHIGTALLRALLPSIPQAGSPISEITVALNRKESATRLQNQFRDSPAPVKFVSRENVKATANADAILFAFPPDQIQGILGAVGMREALKHKIIISILARTPSTEIIRLLGDHQTSGNENTQIIRAMPTIGTEIHESATLIAEPSSKATEAMELASWIFNLVGKVFHVSDSYFDTATGMSAFCNALTTVAIQAIAQKTVAEGVPVHHAIAISSQCIRGTVSMILEGTPPEQLKQSLSAPGSITGQAISRLEERGLLELVDSELTGAISRAKNRT